MRGGGAPGPDRAAAAVIPDALRKARRPLCLGIGGGGDVVGALATAEHCRLEYGARPVLGGVTWERRPIDPEPGPRKASEIEGARPIGPEALLARPVLLANAHTHVRSSGVRFAESRMAELLGEETVLVDANHGPAAIAVGLEDAAAALACDLVVFVDVGGDVLAHGDEPGLASPLCDSVLLAAALHMAERSAQGVLGGARDMAERPTPGVLCAVFGIGCDGELTPDEVLARMDEVDERDGLLGRLPIDEPVARRLAEAVEAVPTEASALALRAFRGESGLVEIRGGRRTVDLRPLAAATTFFDPVAAAASAARLALPVRDAPDLRAANEILNSLGVRTELDYENEMATSV
ncbi:MAG TPA: DUF1152 domain-containing protein [Thermoleophilaceae bacterium]|nr:DUF1152 domain-containing protein [Thermoleophilaceae bacterium]